MCPRQGRGRFSPEEDAILVSFLRQDGLHLVLLAVSQDDVLSVIQPDKDGNLIAVARNERTASSKAYTSAAVARTFEAANEGAICQAKSIIGKEKNITVTRMKLTIKRFLASSP